MRKNMQFEKSAFFSYKVNFAPARKSNYKRISFGSFIPSALFNLNIEMSPI